MSAAQGGVISHADSSNSLKSSLRGDVPRGASTEELLQHFTLRFPENKGKDAPKNKLTLCEQLEMLQNQTEVGIRLTDFLDTIPKKKERFEELDNFMKTLSEQKAAQREQGEKKKMRRSTPELPERPFHVLSTLHGSASYSFGKPVHKKGKFKIPVLQVRDADYGRAEPSPGAGEYSQPSVTFPEESKGVSQTGGWKSIDHQAFMERLKKHRYKPTQGFFEHLYHEMTHVARLEIIDHVHWLAEFNYHMAEKQWNIDTYVEEREQLAMIKQTKRFPSLQEQEQKLKLHRKEVIAEKRKRSELHAWADMEERRLGLKRKVVKDEFQPHQRFEGEVLEGNIRGPHPCYKKSAGFTWSCSKEDRDLTAKKMTDLSHVRSSSHLDNVGPGHYIGHEEESRLLKKSASYSLVGRRAPPKGDVFVEGPGYTGPEHAQVRLAKDLSVISHHTNKPKWTMPKEDARAQKISNERHALEDKVCSPPEVGPGKYILYPGMHTQYFKEAEAFRRQPCV